MISLSKQTGNGVSGIKNGATPGQVCVMAQATPGRHPATVSRRLKIGTWNVKTLQVGKLENVKNEMKHLDVDVMGIAEMRWKGSARIKSRHHTINYSGEDSTAESRRLDPNERMSRSLLGRLANSDRVLVAKFKTSLFDLHTIQVYAPTARSDDSAKKFYEEVGKAIKQAKSWDLLIVMDDFNA